MQTVERFTAWCACPDCSLVDCHRMREPRTRSQSTVMRTRRLPGGEVVVFNDFSHVYADETETFEVIRMCRCGHEWGQG